MSLRTAQPRPSSLKLLQEVGARLSEASALSLRIFLPPDPHPDMIAARNSGVRHTPPMATTHRLDEDRAVEAASAALRECDHSRLPAWMLARISAGPARLPALDRLAQRGERRDCRFQGESAPGDVKVIHP